MNDKLIDGIIFNNNSLFQKEDIELQKYKYKNKYVEYININDLLDTKYLEEFIPYLIEFKDDDDFKSSLIIQLLIIRIYELNDEKAFKILLTFSKNETISYNGSELYEMLLMRIFIENLHFFIEQCYKNNDSNFLKYITSLFNQYFLNNEFFELNMGYVKSNGGELLLNPKVENKFGTSFKKTINKLPKVEIIFSPSLYTNWENKLLYFTNINSIFEKDLTDKLSIGASIYYKLYILPELNKYIINVNENSNDKTLSTIDIAEMNTFFRQESNQSTYTIHDSDGYTNLRKEKNSSSEVLQKIKSGENIEVLDNTGDWWQVKTNEGKIGYVHKSRIKSGTNSHPTAYLLYDRPDFSSFSREIITKGETEIVHQSTGWDFVKVDGTVGYLPTEDNKQDLEKNKFSFLAEEEDIKPAKKKGFWGNLFS